MEIRAVRYTEKYKDDWNLFIGSAKNGLFFFNRNFMDYHSDRFTDHSLLFFKGNKIIAVFPANENNNIIYSHQGLTYGSLIISIKIRTPAVLEIFKSLYSYFKSLGFSKIIYKPIPYIFSRISSQEDLYALFRFNAKLIRRDLSTAINLKDKIKFSETKRQLVRKCKSENVEFTETEHFCEYWNLLLEVLEKYKTKPVHSLAEIQLLKSKFPDNIKLFTAKKDKKLLAGIVIFDFENVVHTQYMANTNEGKKIGALDFLNNELVELYADRNYYSFGISTEAGGKKLNEGLLQQKENMGGRAIVLDWYEIDLLT